MHHFSLITVGFFTLLELIDPELCILELSQKLLVGDLQFLNNSLLLRVLAHLLINFFNKCVVNLTVLPQLDQLVVFLVLLEHIVFYLHHDIETHLFEFRLNFVVLLL